MRLGWYHVKKHAIEIGVHGGTFLRTASVCMRNCEGLLLMLSELNGADRALMIRAYIILAKVEATLRQGGGLQRLIASCKKLEVTSNRTLFDSCLALDQISWAVENVSSCYRGHTKCLEEAFASFILSRQYQVNAALVIGVQLTPDGKFSAHAWLEAHGDIVHQPPTDLSYREMCRIT